MRAARRGCLGLLLAGLAPVLAGRTLAAQEPAPAPVVRSVAASPSLSPGDWAWDALRRLAGLGLAPWPDRAEGFAMRSEVARAFAEAARRAASDRPELAPLARGYLDRFLAEYDLPQPDSSDDAARAHWRDLAPRLIRAGYARRTGLVLAGVGYDTTDWTGAQPVPDTSTALLSARWESTPDRHLAMEIEPELRSGGLQLRGAQAVVLLGPIGIWGGRHTARFSPAAGGGIVLSGDVVQDGAGAFVPGSFRFPWLFRGMGPIRMQVFFSHVRGGDRIRNPWFGAFRGSMTPHPRLTIALNRGVMFGGAGNLPITAKNLLWTAAGARVDKVGVFANEVLSVDVQYRPPLGPLPVSTYLEWGMDDGSGAWHHVPAYTAGAELAAVPGLPQLALGAERTSFAPSCCSNTMWYRNFALRNGWADDGVPVGHPLAGEGWQWLGFAALDLLDARVQLRGAAFARNRGDENLLAPQRVGRSWGGGGGAVVRLGPRLQLDGRGEFERGDAGWRAASLTVTAGWRP